MPPATHSSCSLTLSHNVTWLAPPTPLSAVQVEECRLQLVVALGEIAAYHGLDRERSREVERERERERVCVCVCVRCMRATLSALLLFLKFCLGLHLCLFPILFFNHFCTVW